MSDLEKQLATLKLRAVPPDLRREVLKACEEKGEPSTFSFQLSAFLRSLYPGHALSGSLACVWLFILVLHLDTPESAAPSGPAISFARWKEAKVERDLFLAQMETPRFEVDLKRGSFSLPKEDLRTN